MQLSAPVIMWPHFVNVYINKVTVKYFRLEIIKIITENFYANYFPGNNFRYISMLKSGQIETVSKGEIFISTLYIELLFIDVPVLVLLILASVTDIRKRRIPNIICICMLFPVFSKILAEALTGESTYSHITKLLTDMAIGGAIALVITGIPFLINKSIGGGDVKLLSVCGLYTGLRGSVTVIFTAFITCAITALAIMLIKRRRIASLPFAPFILAGTVCFLLSAYLS